MKPKFCPKCKSTNVRLNMTTLSSIGGESPSWKCNECGFSSPEFPELKKKVKKE